MHYVLFTLHARVQDGCTARELASFRRCHAISDFMDHHGARSAVKTQGGCMPYLS